MFGADVNITNKRYETPRHLATLLRQQQWREVVRAVGFVGAVACDKSKNGCTLECSEPFQEEMMIGKKTMLSLQTGCWKHMTTSTRIWMFLKPLFFHTKRPSVHMKPVNLPTETASFIVVYGPVHTNAINKKRCFKNVRIRMDGTLRSYVHV